MGRHQSLQIGQNPAVGPANYNLQPAFDPSLHQSKNSKQIY